MLTCPFCGAQESDRFDLDGHRFLVFRCMFTPQVDPRLSETELEGELRRLSAERSQGYFQGMCDRLHLYVTKGEGAQRLLNGPPPGSKPGS